MSDSKGSGMRGRNQNESLADGIDWVAIQFDAVERGDLDTMRASFAPGAIVWHNDDGVERSVDELISMFQRLSTIVETLRYSDRRVTAVGNVQFVQQVITGDLRAGGTLKMHTMMRVDLAEDGKVLRIEEYYDGKALETAGVTL